MMLSWKLLVVDLIIIVLKPMKMLYTEMIVFSLYEFIWKSQQYRDIYTLFHFSHTFVLEKCFFICVIIQLWMWYYAIICLKLKRHIFVCIAVYF